MAYTKGTYPSLIGGITEQIQQTRQANQVQAQLNMLSDPVTGPRRRGAMPYAGTLQGLTGKHFKSELFEVGNEIYALVVGVALGEVRLYSIETRDYAPGELIQTYSTDYVSTPDRNAIKFAKHGSGIVILNTDQTVQLAPALAEKALEPARQGYFYIQGGALGTQFDVTYQLGRYGAVHTITHTTGTSSAKGAVPRNIANKLYEKLLVHPEIGTAQGWVHQRIGAYVYSRAPAGSAELRIQSPLGVSQVRTSRNHNILDSSELPARLPKEADGFVMTTGKLTEFQYFEWDHENTRWNERAAYGLRRPILNLPRLFDIRERTLKDIKGTGRLSGDLENAENPYFIGKKLTGVGSFQGRLILLCNEYVFFTSSKNELFWRKSAGSLADDDPIEIAGVTSYGLSYKYTVPFMGDLLILAESAQALIPGSVLLTPKTASLSIASEYQMSLEARPLLTGKSLIYAAPNVTDGSSIWEMVPSEYTNRNLYAQNITEHVPTMFKGKVRQVAGLDAAGYVLFRDDSDRLKVHQYLWAGSDKVHSSFAEWELTELIHELHSSDTAVYVFVAGTDGAVHVLSWEHTPNSPNNLHLDRFTKIQRIQRGVFRAPYSLFTQTELLSGDVSILQYTENGTPYYVKPLAIYNEAGNTWRLEAEDFSGTGDVGIGMHYKSMLQPSAPILRDGWNQPILLERAVLHMLTVRLQDSGEFTLYFKDRARPETSLEFNPYRLYETNLDPGAPAIGSDVLNIPLRLDMSTAEFRFETSSPYDMWIPSLEYGFRHNQRFKRTVVRGAESDEV